MMHTQQGMILSVSSWWGWRSIDFRGGHRHHWFAMVAHRTTPS